MSTSPEQTYLARTFDDGRWAWTRARHVRRRAVLAETTLLLALVAATVVSATTPEGWTTTYFVIWTIGLLGFVPLHSVLNLGVRGVLDRDKRSLDEYQRRLGERSDSAVARPRMALSSAAWTGAVAVAALTEHVALALCLGFLLWFASGLVTYWHLAWTAPVEPSDVDA